MDSEARGEVTAPVVFLDEDGQAFAFLSLRVIHDGAVLFVLAERADERFLADPHAHLENPSRTVGSAS